MPMELIKELGRRIQKARKEKGLTQQELADLSHVSLKHVQGCERGVKNPSFEVLRAFCKVLNLYLDSLMNLDLPEDEQAANDMRQLYLSCPPAARKVLLGFFWQVNPCRIMSKRSLLHGGSLLKPPCQRIGVTPLSRA